jgi:autotransporter-associated beta strand protein
MHVRLARFSSLLALLASEATAATLVNFGGQYVNGDTILAQGQNTMGGTDGTFHVAKTGSTVATLVNNASTDRLRSSSAAGVIFYWKAADVAPGNSFDFSGRTGALNVIMVENVTGSRVYMIVEQDGAFYRSVNFTQNAGNKPFDGNDVAAGFRMFNIADFTVGGTTVFLSLTNATAIGFHLNTTANNTADGFEAYGVWRDIAPPAVATLVPAHGATNVSIASPLTVVFNKSIRAGNGNITLRNVTDSQDTIIGIDDGTRVAISNATLTVTPSAPLLAGRQYAVLIDATAILSTNGFAYPGITNDTDWSFVTASAADHDPPNWAAGYPKADTRVSDGFTLRMRIDESGAGYYVVVTAPSALPSVAEVMAGTGKNGAVAVRGGSLPLIQDAENSIAFADFAPSTAYDVYCVARDALSNRQTVVSNLEVSTRSDVFDWDGATSATWSTGSNWGEDLAPADSALRDTARFNGGWLNAPSVDGTRGIKGIAIGASNGVMVLDGLPGANLIVGSGGIAMQPGAGAFYLGQNGRLIVTLAASQTWANYSASLFDVPAGVSGVGSIDLGTNELTIDVTGSGDVRVDARHGILGTGGKLRKTGSGALFISPNGPYTADPTFSGGFEVVAGPVTVEKRPMTLPNSAIVMAGGSLTAEQDLTCRGLTGVAAASLAIWSSRRLTLNTAAGASYSYAGSITDLGSVIKTGIGTQALTHATGNTYAGGTTVRGGCLRLVNTNGSATGSGSVTVSNAVLSGSGSIAGNVTLWTGGAIRLEAADRLSIGGNVTNFANSAYTFRLGTSDGWSDTMAPARVAIAGTLTVAAPVEVRVTEAASRLGFYAIISYGTLDLGGETFDQIFRLDPLVQGILLHVPSRRAILYAPRGAGAVLTAR